LTFDEDVESPTHIYPAVEVRRILDWQFKQNPRGYWRSPEGNITSKRRLAIAIDKMNEDVPRKTTQPTQKKYYSAADLEADVERLFKELPVCPTYNGTGSVKGKFTDEADCPECQERRKKLTKQVTSAR
jgi:hypothetical protein